MQIRFWRSSFDHKVWHEIGIFYSWMPFFKTITLTLCVRKLRMGCGCSSGKNGTGGCSAIKANLRLRIWWESRLSRPFLHQLKLILNPRISISLSARYPSEAHWTALFKQTSGTPRWLNRCAKLVEIKWKRDYSLYFLLHSYTISHQVDNQESSNYWLTSGPSYHVK